MQAVLFLGHVFLPARWILQKPLVPNKTESLGIFPQRVQGGRSRKRQEPADYGVV